MNEWIKYVWLKAILKKKITHFFSPHFHNLYKLIYIFFCTQQGTLKRRHHLHEAKFFWCTCERCKSNDELGTHASTLLCPKCTYGYILSTDTLNESAEWRYDHHHALYKFLRFLSVLKVAARLMFA